MRKVAMPELKREPAAMKSVEKGTPNAVGVVSIPEMDPRPPLQNQRSGSSAESRICDFIEKCGGLPTHRYDGWEFCRVFRRDWIKLLNT
jgi:hypothetical protein